MRGSWSPARRRCQSVWSPARVRGASATKSSSGTAPRTTAFAPARSTARRASKIRTSTACRPRCCTRRSARWARSWSSPTTSITLPGSTRTTSGCTTSSWPTDPTRLIGLYQMPAIDIDVSVAKLREAKSLGFRGVILAAYPSGNPKLTDDDDPFWAAAGEEGIPIHIHVGLSQAGHAPKGRCRARGDAATRRSRSSSPGCPTSRAWAARSPTRRASCRSSSTRGCSTASPSLKLVAAEIGAGLDPELARAHGRPLVAEPHVDRLPARADAERVLPPQLGRSRSSASRSRWRSGTGSASKNLMWSTDYPHHRHDWPYSRRVIEESMAGVPEDERTP